MVLLIRLQKKSNITKLYFLHIKFSNISFIKKYIASSKKCETLRKSLVRVRVLRTVRRPIRIHDSSKPYDNLSYVLFFYTWTPASADDLASKPEKLSYAYCTVFCFAISEIQRPYFGKKHKQ